MRNAGLWFEKRISIRHTGIFQLALKADTFVSVQDSQGGGPSKADNFNYETLDN